MMLKMGIRTSVAVSVLGITALLVMVYSTTSSDRAPSLLLGFSALQKPGASESTAAACPPKGPPTVRIVEALLFPQWWAAGHHWHEPSRLPRCSMDVCFDYSRCDNMSEVLIFLYDAPAAPPARYFQGLRNSSWLTPDPAKACIFLVFEDFGNESARIHPSSLPHWNGGLNHVLVSFADRWYSDRLPQESIGNASLAMTAEFETTYRTGFDISIPLPGKTHRRELQAAKPMDRKYFATFKGLRYLGNNEGDVRSSAAFRSLHNGDDVIVATSCNHINNDKLRKAQPELGAHCDDDERIYRQYDYVDLLNTTFALVPAGRQPNSYRFIETLSAGAIPILIIDNYVKPFESLVQWQRCVLQFPTNEVARVIPALRSLAKADVEERQRYCLFVYHEFLKDEPTLLRSVVRSLKIRFMNTFAPFIETVPLFPGK